MDCPALHHQSEYYPNRFKLFSFAQKALINRIPKNIIATKTVSSDLPYTIFGKPLKVIGGEEYEAWTNSNGAVSAMVNGEFLGLRPDEFVVKEWF